MTGSHTGSKKPPHRLILCNDGGTLAGPTLEAPIGAEGLVKLTIDPLRDTGIDTLYWQLGTDPFRGYFNSRLSDIYSHRTEVGYCWGDKGSRFPSAGTWRIHENTRSMMEEGTDPPEVIIESGHRAGLSVFLSMRVNDMHDGRLGDPEHPLLSPMKRAHPEWLLGLSATPWEGSRNYGFSRFAYDFAVPEVREYKLALARETIENYDLDGLDFDFVRFPRLFRKDTGSENAPLITEMLRALKGCLDEKSERLGRPLEFSVRVPPTFEHALAFGLDVQVWIEEQLIDVLIAGVVQGDMRRLPVEAFVEKASGSGIRVIAQNPGFYNGGRPASSQVIWGGPPYCTPEMCRASALAHWRAGVDGLYLWNDHLIPFSLDQGYARTSWHEIADPDTLKRRDKHYLLDDRRIKGGMDGEQEYSTAPDGPIPTLLNEVGDVAAIKLDVADDVETARDEGVLLSASLRTMIVHLTALDELSYRLNEHALDRKSASCRLLYNDCWLEWEVGPLLRLGWNELQLRVRKRNPCIDAPLRVESVEVLLRYRGTKN